MHKLANQIKDIHFDWYVAISRGGLIPATLLAEITGQKNIETLIITRYTDLKDTTSCTIIDKDLSHLNNKHVLLIDDIIDHGKTVYEALRMLKNTATVQVATVFWKTHSIVCPDFYIHKSDKNEWITFPWERNQEVEVEIG